MFYKHFKVPSIETAKEKTNVKVKGLRYIDAPAREKNLERVGHC